MPMTQNTSSVEGVDPLTILVRVFKHVSNSAKAPNDDAPELLRPLIVGWQTD
jgi:hypothetical protein